MSTRSTVSVICALLTVAYCASRNPHPAATIADRPALIQPAEDTQSPPEVQPEQIRGGETYEQFDARRDALATGRYSGGDECTENCEGHDAGREWAEAHSITDPDECGGNSWSFEEGCRSYAEEQQDDGRRRSPDEASEGDGAEGE
jgi:hypothetical protein